MICKCQTAASSLGPLQCSRGCVHPTKPLSTSHTLNACLCMPVCVGVCDCLCLCVCVCVCSIQGDALSWCVCVCVCVCVSVVVREAFLAGVCVCVCVCGWGGDIYVWLSYCVYK